jgi:hypothetical protein
VVRVRVRVEIMGSVTIKKPLRFPYVSEISRSHDLHPHPSLTSSDSVVCSCAAIRVCCCRTSLSSRSCVHKTASYCGAVGVRTADTRW